MESLPAACDPAEVPPTEAAFELKLDAYPALAQLLSGPDAAQARRELVELQMASRWQRAERYHRNLLARVVPDDAEDPAAELCAAVVRDISASGARVWLEPEASLDRMASVTLEIRVPGDRKRVAVAAEMVRIAGKSAQSVEVAFRFLDSEEAAESLSELLALLAEQ